MASPYFSPPLAQVLRLEVEAAAPTGTVLNLLENHSGETYALGAYQWVSPLGVDGVIRDTDTTHTAGRAAVLTYKGQPSNIEANPVESYFATELLRITPSTYVGASWIATWAAQSYRARLEFFDPSGNYISATGQTGILTASAARQVLNYTSAAPTTASFVRLRFDIVTSTGSVFRPSSASTADCLSLTEVMVGNAPTQTPVNNVAFSTTNVLWSNVVGSLHEVRVTRRELDLGTLSATVLDASLDPATSGGLRAGRRIRLTAYNPATATQEPIFVGRVRDASVTYDQRRSDTKRARISLEAVDGVAQLAGIKRARAYTSLSGMAEAVEGCGLPWRVGLLTSHWTNLNSIGSYNPDASALDQVGLWRDTFLGYAWVSRAGVVNLQQSLASTTVATLTEADYSDLSTGFNTAAIINSVKVTMLRTLNNGVQNPPMSETEHGPYLDAASISEWGMHAVEATIFWRTTQTDPAAYAASVLAANAQPKVACDSLTLPIMGNTHVTKAMLDLYDKVRVINTASGFDRELRITGITHRITATSWHVDLRFDTEGSVASPASQPGISATATGGATWTSPTLTNGWTDYGSPYSPVAFRKDGDRVTLRGLVRNGSTGACFVLPEGYRPPFRTLTSAVVFSSTETTTATTRTSSTNNNHSHTVAVGGVSVAVGDTGHRIDIYPDGSVTIPSGVSNSYVSLDGISFYVT